MEFEPKLRVTYILISITVGEINSGAAFHKDKDNASGDSAFSGGAKGTVKKNPPPASLRITDDLDDGVKKQQEKVNFHLI